MWKHTLEWERFEDKFLLYEDETDDCMVLRISRPGRPNKTKRMYGTELDRFLESRSTKLHNAMREQLVLKESDLEDYEDLSWTG